MLSHAEMDLEPPTTSQRSGNQRALVTFGLSRISLLKRKIIRAIVRKRARDRDKPMPNKLAMWGTSGFIDYETIC
jgi:hypothetical protein